MARSLAPRNAASVTAAAAEVIVVAPHGDAACVLGGTHGFTCSAFEDPGEALAHLRELRSKRLPVVFVVGRSDVPYPPLLVELSTRHPDVPVVVATHDGTKLSAPTYVMSRPARSRALIDAVSEASRSASQLARVRTTLDHLNFRLSSQAATQDPAQQRRLLLSRIYFDNLLQQTHDAMFVTDRSGTVALWNPAAERVFEVPAAKIVGNRLAVVGPEVGRRLLEAVEALSPRRQAMAIALAFDAASGRREVEVTLSLISDSGQAIAVAGIGRDVTEQRRLQHALEDRARALAESNRHKDEFLAILSHELRTPLNVVLGWAHILETNADGPDGIQRAVAMIKRNAQLQQRLVEDLLEYARIVAGRLELQLAVVQVSDLVRSTLDSLKPTIADAGLTLHESYETARFVRVDADRLRQVVVNLVTNATKFTPAGGEIRVHVGASNGSVTISVADTGVGIAPEFLSYVFDEFRQANPSSTRKQSGIGLGLSISRRLVEMHQGRIEARSAGVGAGAEFIVSLPAVDETPTSA
jgi:PAS domain S-box-containing protein